MDNVSYSTFHDMNDLVGFWEILVITAIFTEYAFVVSAVIYQAFAVMAVFVAWGDASLSACVEGGISARLSWMAADVYRPVL